MYGQMPDGTEVATFGDFGGGNGDCDTIPGCYDRSLEYTWTATDACDNVTSATTVLTVLDTEEPVFADCPADMQLECDETVPPMGDCLASDNCTADDYIVYTSHDNITKPMFRLLYT